MNEATWNALVDECQAKWPKMPFSGWEAQEAKRRCLRLQLSAEQVEAAFANLCLSGPKWPQLSHVVSAMQAASQTRRAVEATRGTPEPEERRTERSTSPWVLYERNPTEAVRVYPWLLEPCVVNGVGYARWVDHPMYADLRVKRVQSRAEADAECRQAGEAAERARKLAGKPAAESKTLTLGQILSGEQ